MLSITTLIIAAVFFIILLLVSIFVPNPITWLMTLALGAVFYFILWPKYQGQQQAVRQGVEIQAASVSPPRLSRPKKRSRKQTQRPQRLRLSVRAVLAAEPNHRAIRSLTKRRLK